MRGLSTRLMVAFAALAIISLGCSDTFAAESASACMATARNNECADLIILTVGGSEVITLDKPSKSMKIVSSNDKVVDIKVLKQNQLYLRGKDLGYSTIMIYDDDSNKVVAKFEVDVKEFKAVYDLTSLKKQISTLFPGQNIKAETTKNAVILSGDVTGPEIVDGVLRLTQAFLGISMGAADENLNTQVSDKVILTQGGQTVLTRNDFKTGRSGANIINLLKISGPQQVMLEVKFAEVSRKSGRDLQAGFAVRGLDKDFAGAIGTGTLPGGSAGPAADLGSLLVNLANNAANVFIRVDDFSLVLNFLEGENLARTLAEPRLVTQSGQEASFLAGGEYPYPVDNGTDGIEIEFKEFGVGLKFTPIVNSDGMITLRVAPSVTDVVSTVETAAGLQPVLSTRRTESTVQLRDGQTLAMAGLLKENMNNIVEKVPLLGDLPVIGALFRSSSFREEKTDLIVAITPHLVKPVKEGETSFPGEFIKPPNRFEFYLEGRLEGRRSPDDRSALSEHSFTMAQSAGSGGLEGQFGHTEAK